MPLILPSQRLIRPNPLAYPAGAVPGIDRSHPASQNCTFSGIATQGGTFGNILSRVKGTENGTKTTSLYGSLGLATDYTNGNSGNTIFPFLSAASAPITLAGIFKMTATAVSPAYLLNNSAGGTVGIGDVTPDGTFSGFHEVGGTQNVGTGVSYILGVPYFFAMSFSVTLINWVVARLDTGQVFTGHVTNTTGVIDAGDGNITVGSRSGANRQLGGAIAAAMANNAFMSQQKLVAWAADPWSFWYPRPTIQYTTPATTTTTGGARIRQRFNRSPLAYPAGAVPGFNRALPYGQVGRALSVVANPGNFVSLETYNGGTIAGTPISTIDSLIGPCITFPTFAEEIKFPFTIANPNYLVLAGITRLPATAGGTGAAQYIVNTFNTSNGSAIFFNAGGDLGYFDCGGVINIMLPAGTPGLLGGAFFIIVSIANSGINNWSVTDLSSGKVYSGSNTATSGAGTENFFTLGNRDDQARSFSGGYIAAAAAMKDTSLSVEELAQYARDPWSFWYPRNMQSLFTQAGTPVVTTNYAAFSIPQHSLSQLANRMIGY